VCPGGEQHADFVDDLGIVVHLHYHHVIQQVRKVAMVHRMGRLKKY
jgi:hypothetical protein